MGYLVIGLKSLIFFISQGDLLRIKYTSELVCNNSSLSQRIMILKELSETDPIFLDNRLKLEHQVSNFLFTNKHPLFTNVLLFLGLIQFLHLLLERLEWSTISDELKILDLIIIGAVDGIDGLHLLVRHDEAEVVECLPELLGRDLEVLVTIPILEEALGVQSVSCEPVLEGCEDVLHDGSLVMGGILTPVEGLGAHVI